MDALYFPACDADYQSVHKVTGNLPQNLVKPFSNSDGLASPDQ